MTSAAETASVAFASSRTSPRSRPPRSRSLRGSVASTIALRRRRGPTRNLKPRARRLRRKKATRPPKLRIPRRSSMPSPRRSGSHTSSVSKRICRGTKPPWRNFRRSSTRRCCWEARRASSAGSASARCRSCSGPPRAASWPSWAAPTRSARSRCYRLPTSRTEKEVGNLPPPRPCRRRRDRQQPPVPAGGQRAAPRQQELRRAHRRKRIWRQGRRMAVRIA
mmetsp:Transcript_75238/g.211918  ORF Transcript_75238/g.211918 Transcript_75238/m.211918 type:complete len:222 (+) Transcript_75238:485-1150(+)